MSPALSTAPHETRIGMDWSSTQVQTSRRQGEPSRLGKMVGSDVTPGH